MIGAILPQGRLNESNVIAIGSGDQWDLWFTIRISCDLNRNLNCLSLRIESIPILIWEAYDIGNMWWNVRLTRSKTVPWITSPICPQIWVPPVRIEVVEIHSIVETAVPFISDGGWWVCAEMLYIRRTYTATCGVPSSLANAKKTKLRIPQVR